MKKSLIAASIVLASSSLFADGQPYVGAAYQMGFYLEDENAIDAEFSALQLTLGYAFNDSSSLEVRYITNGSGEAFSYNGSESEVYVDNALSFFYKYNLNVSNQFSIYGLLGYSEGGFEADLGDASSSVEGLDGVSYGGGLSYQFSDSASIFAEYVSYFTDAGDGDYADYTGSNIGVNFYFE